MRLRLCLAFALALVTLATFWRVQENDFLRYDDHIYVTQNGVVQQGLTREGMRWAFTEFAAFNWHPLSWLSHMLDYELYALHPAGHHRTSLLLHVANAALLFWAFVAMTAAPWRSAFVAGLFALHPLHVESVSWVAERKDVLSAFFAFAMLIAWAAWARRGSLVAWSAALVCFALGLLAKPMLVTLPFVLLLLDLWPLRRYEPRRWRAPEGPRGGSLPPARLVLEKLPFFALAAASCVVTLLAQHSGGAVKTFDEYPLSFRLINVLTAYPGYLARTLWPVDLVAFYPYPEAWFLSEVVVAIAFLAVMSRLAVSRMRSHPYLLVGWLWYLGMLVPVIGIVQVGYQQMADRYTYLPLIGIFAAVVWVLADAVARVRHGSLALALAGGVVLAACASLSWVQIGHWRDNQTLFEHAIRVDPDNWLARFFIANVQLNRGELEPAIQNLRHVLERVEATPARLNLAIGLWQNGELDEAWRNFGLVLRSQPRDATAHLGAARVARDRGDLTNAVHHFGQSLQLQLSEEAYLGLRSSLFALRRRYADQSFVPQEVSLLRAEDQMEYFMGRRFDELDD